MPRPAPHCGPARSTRHAAPRRTAFTLIELLIVVAIISILAAIAVPNFLEAQTRAKISRVRSDMRTVATALETFRIDRNQYPLYYNALDGTPLSDHPEEITFVPTIITTPISYLTSVPRDSFPLKFAEGTNDPAPDLGPLPFHYRRYLRPGTQDWAGPTIIYGAGHVSVSSRVRYAYDCYNLTGWYLDETRLTARAEWQLASPGPDSYMPTMQRALEPQYWSVHNPEPGFQGLRYDPTNGTVSRGDVVRFGP